MKSRFAPRTRSLDFAALESRRLLACTTTLPVTLVGTAGEDVIDVERKPATVRIQVNNIATYFDAATVGSIVIDGLGGNDRVTFIDFSGSDNDAEVCPGNVHLNNGGGNHGDVDLYFANMEDTLSNGGGSNGSAVVMGSAGDDTVISAFVSVPSTYIQYPGSSVRLNGYEDIFIDSGGGNDRAFFNGSRFNETMISSPTSTRYSYELWNSSVVVNNFVYAQGTSNGGDDLLALNGSAADNDNLYATPEFTVLHSGAGSSSARGIGFETVVADGQGGNDEAALIDSLDNDQFYARPGFANLTTPQATISAANFEQVNAFATAGGHDSASILDSNGDDAFYSGPNGSSLTGDGFKFFVQGFDRVNAFGSAGDDFAAFANFTGEQRFYGGPNSASVSTSGLYATAQNFDRVSSSSDLTETDSAFMLDSRHADEFFGTLSGRGNGLKSVAIMQNSSYFISLLDYPTVKIASVGGDDAAYLVSPATIGLFEGSPIKSSINTDPNLKRGNFEVEGFEKVIGAFNNRTPNLQNRAVLTGSPGVDGLFARRHQAVLSNPDYRIVVNGADSLSVYGNGGNDQANLRDTAADDKLSLAPDFVHISAFNGVNSGGYDIFLHDFPRVTAYASFGEDRAGFTDSAGNDTFFANQSLAYLEGIGFRLQTVGFGFNLAGTSGGFDRAYLYDSPLGDVFTAEGSRGTLRGNSGVFTNVASGFDQIHAVSVNGGFDQLIVGEIDYNLYPSGRWVVVN